MTARGAILVFAAAGVAIAALSSPAAGQDNFGVRAADQERRIDEIEADLTGLEAAVRWDGDPCRRIHRGASKLLDRLVDEEFLSSDLPLEMIRAWRARVDRLFKICPNEVGLIGDPSVAAPLSVPPPQDAGPRELAEWWTSEQDAIHNEFRRIEGLTDPAEISSANAKLKARIARLEQLYRSRQGKPYPALIIEFWTKRLDRLIDRQRQLLELERQGGNQPSNSRGPATAQPIGEQKGGGQIGQATPASSRAYQRILDRHNRERTAFGLAPLRWNAQLAKNAQDHANHLARTGQLAHASREGRGIERENVNQGMLGWNTDQMMANWLNEKRNFIPGTFPNVSRTGNWSDVGHYSQMIWPQTTDIGCGLATGSGYQWLVCRYSPGGNKDGKPVGIPASAN